MSDDSSSARHILVTGGTGYVGSHTALQLVQGGHRVTVLDNLHNSHAASLDRIRSISGRSVSFVEGDIRDRGLLNDLCRQANFDAVIHFAAMKSISESLQDPLAYYDINVGGSINLLHAMAGAGIRQLVFSSSATVYGAATNLPIREEAPRSSSNPYGQTKIAIENLLASLCASDDGWRVAGGGVALFQSHRRP